MGNGSTKGKKTYDDDGNEISIINQAQLPQGEQEKNKEEVILDKDGKPVAHLENAIKLLICPFCRIEIADFALIKARTGMKIHAKCQLKKKDKIYKIETFLAILEEPSNKAPKNCSSTDHTEKGEAFCPECAEWFCSECLRYHHKYLKNHKITDHHVIVNCSKHRKDFIYYCKDCDKSLCIECQLSHNDHTLESLPPINIEYLELYHKKIGDIIKANAEIGKQFVRRITAEMVTASIKSKINQMNFWIKDINTIFKNNELTNLLLQMLIDYVLQTAAAYKGHPNFHLIKMVNAIRINNNEPDYEGKTLAQTYHILKNHFLNNFVLLVDTQQQISKKERQLNTSCIRTGILHNGTITCMIVLINSDSICSGSSDTTIKIWNPQSFKCSKTLKGHTETVFCLLQIKDDALLSGSYDETIIVWNIVAGTCIGKLLGHTGAINDMILMTGPETPIRLVSASYDKRIKIWDIEASSCKKTAESHNWSVQCVLQLKMGMIASGSLDKTIKLWKKKPFKCKASMIGHTWGVMSLVELFDGSLASASMDCTIKMWNLETLKCTRTLEGHTERIVKLLELPDGGLATCSHDKTVRLWKKEKYTCYGVLYGHNYLVQSLVKLKNGGLISGAVREVKVWNV